MKPSSRPPRLAKEVTAMGWLEDRHGRVLLIRQTRGRKPWSLPGGKLEPSESLRDGLAREVFEETNLTITFASQVAIFDRPDRCNLTILFRIRVADAEPAITRPHEIAAIAHASALPRITTPSLRHFWHLLRPTPGKKML